MSRRSFFDRVLFPIIARQPGVGLALADLVHQARYRLRPGRTRRLLTSRGDWEKLLGPQDRRRHHEIRLRQFRNLGRTALLEKYLKRFGPEGASDIRRWRHLERLQQPIEEGRPVVIALAHVGPLFASILGLQSLNRPMTLILHRKISGPLSGDWEMIYTEQGKAARIQAFRKAIARLRQGRPVVMAADIFGESEDSLPARVFDLDLKLQRGFAALSRATGAIVVPVSIRWEGLSTLVYEAHPPLESSRGDRSDREAFEQAVIDEYAGVLDDYMRAHPYDLDPGRAGQFVKAWNRLRLEQDGLIERPAEKIPA